MCKTNEMNSKRVVYTVITNDYDDLRQPLVIDERYDYICFCNDKPEGKEGIWEIKHFDIEFQDEMRASRRPKMKPHEVLPEYKYSLYIDANVDIRNRLIYDAIDSMIERGVKVGHVDHIWRQCLYSEIHFCLWMGFDKGIDLLRTYWNVLKHHFPYNAGLFENNIIFREHNDCQLVNAGIMWWNLYKKYTKRDQCHLMYVYWLLGIRPELLLPQYTNSRNSSHISVLEHKPGKDKKHDHNRMDYMWFKFRNSLWVRIIKLSGLQLKTADKYEGRILLHNGYNGPDESLY